jgi:hypothetical protein
MAVTRGLYLNPIQNGGGLKFFKVKLQTAAILFWIDLLRSGLRHCILLIKTHILVPNSTHVVYHDFFAKTYGVPDIFWENAIATAFDRVWYQNVGFGEKNTMPQSRSQKVDPKQNGSNLKFDF